METIKEYRLKDNPNVVVKGIKVCYNNLKELIIFSKQSNNFLSLERRSESLAQFINFKYEYILKTARNSSFGGAYHVALGDYLILGHLSGGIRHFSPQTFNKSYEAVTEDNEQTIIHEQGLEERYEQGLKNMFEGLAKQQKELDSLLSLFSDKSITIGEMKGISEEIKNTTRFIEDYRVRILKASESLVDFRQKIAKENFPVWGEERGEEQCK